MIKTQQNIKIDFQSKAKLIDPQRSLFIAYVPFKLRADLYKLIYINGELASIRGKVSEAAQGLTHLQFWLIQLENICRNQELQVPQSLWLKEMITYYDLSLEDLQKWIIIRQKEYEPMPISSMESWWNYMNNTGGMLERFWLQIIGEKNTETVHNAEAIGSLWASVGCLRSIGFHSYIRLNLLPKELLYEQGFLLPDGWRATAKDDLSPIVAYIAFETQKKLEKLKNIKIHKSLKLKLIYIEIILKYLEKQNYNPFTKDWEKIPRKIYWEILKQAWALRNRKRNPII